MTYNRVILVGRVGRDPDKRATTQGTPVAQFSLATSSFSKDRETKDKKQNTVWHRVITFGKLAEFVGKYITKGRLLLVEGRIQSRDWKDKNDQKRTSFEIWADQVLFLEGKGTTVGATEEGEVEIPPEESEEGDVPF